MKFNVRVKCFIAIIYNKRKRSKGTNKNIVKDGFLLQGDPLERESTVLYFENKFCPRVQAALDGAQLPQMSPRKNGKPSISRMAQKIELVI